MINNYKVNGQIWIDKSSPYNLRYKYNDTEFLVDVKQVYKANSEGIITGNIVYICSDGTIKKAEFPKDLNKVCGLALKKSNQYNLVTSGELIIPVNNDIFVDADISVGDTVYWFIGRVGLLADTNIGKLTVKKPNGLKDKDYSTIDNNTYNVGYNNLPKIGSVKSVDADNIIIHVDMDTFDSEISWYWPEEDEANHTHSIKCGELTPTSNSVNIYHGLFGFSNVNDCYCDCVLTCNDNEGNIYQADADITNNYADNSTTIKVNTIESLHYFVKGYVSYNMDYYTKRA